MLETYDEEHAAECAEYDGGFWDGYESGLEEGRGKGFREWLAVVLALVIGWALAYWLFEAAGAVLGGGL